MTARTSDKRQFWLTPAVPPSIKMALWAYAGMLLPATLAALFAWPWWVGALLLVPGMALYAWSGRIAAAKTKIASRRMADRRLAMVIVVASLIVFMGLAKSLPPYCRPLLFAGYVIVVVDPIWRVGLWIYQQRESPPVTTANGNDS